MFDMKYLVVTVLLLAACLAYAVEEIKAPLKMEDVAAALESKAKRQQAKVEARQDTLVITISDSGAKNGFDGAYTFHNLKRLAGHTLSFVIDVKLTDIAQSDGKIPAHIGFISFGDTRQSLSTRHGDWHTYTFKNVRISGNGMLKLRITLKKNIFGEIQIRNPRIRGNFPKVRDNSVRKKKKKKND